MFSETDRLAVSAFILSILRCLQCLWRISQGLGSTLTNWLLGLTDFMKVLSPAYFMTVAASTGSSTAAAFYEGILLMIWAVQWLLANLFLPAVNLSLLLKMVNYLSKEEILGFLKEVCREVSIPVYGIGGIKFDEEQWNDMKKCGAVGGCVMSGMMEI